MYKKIKNHKTVATIYSEKLVSEKVITLQEFENGVSEFQKKLDSFYNESKDYKTNKADWLEGKWSKMTQYDKEKKEDQKTGVDLATLKKIGQVLTTYPANFKLNSKLQRLLEAKKKMFETGEGFDWATAEAMAFGSLLIENFGVRMTGQDSRRGTFSQRHAVFVDQENETTYTPLNNISDKQEKIQIHDSNLSEFAVLGFEYGYSIVDPNCLTLWEAQFGDFSNSAQIIIDQFISSAEFKWLRMSGLVMLLPHGYEGQGPEHSSARLERYLQLCAEHNMQVVNCTTPANYFHVLRRQVYREYRKPLIVMAPKSLLRHRLVISDIDEMAKNTYFIKVIDEQNKIAAKDKIKRVVVCSGKVYYDLFEEREKSKIKDVAIVRIEQYYPFPKEELYQILKQYKNAEVIWCQEEPKNMGAWRFISYYIENVLIRVNGKCLRPIYVGRPNSASPAAGYMKIHTKQQEQFINDALGKK